MADGSDVSDYECSVCKLQTQDLNFLLMHSCTQGSGTAVHLNLFFFWLVPSVCKDKYITGFSEQSIRWQFWFPTRSIFPWLVRVVKWKAPFENSCLVGLGVWVFPIFSPSVTRLSSMLWSRADHEKGIITQIYSIRIVHFILIKATWPRINQWLFLFSWVKV